MNALLIGLTLAAAHGAVPDTVPLYDNLGDHHYAITTEDPQVQAYFDQGLRLYYAFNHQEAIRAFRHAQSLDASCAMCWWGEALALGPNINAPMDSAAAVAAYEAVGRAVEKRAHASPLERALIDALATRYTSVPPADRAALDSAYARAMEDVADRYPDDPEAAVLYGESLMDLSPWNYWNDVGSPRPGTEQALASFERVMEVNPDHPGACHFFIHAVEAVDPDRAVWCAERLAGLMPGAGHLVHMPGHIYIRVGRYLDAVEANRHAVHADETYIRDQRPGMGMYTAGYYPHNYDFMAFAETMTGRSANAVEAARKMAELVPEEMLGTPGMGFLQHWVTRPLQVYTRFGLWDAILDAPAPAEDLPHARGMWHYARGRALAATGEPAEAEAHLAALREILRDARIRGLRLEFNEAPAVLGVAEAVLAGRVAAARGRTEEALELLREAVAREDALLYGEPPEWTVPARHELGAVLLEAGCAQEAERVYREDLGRFRENGWSLKGLALALRAQGRDEEAAEVEARVRTAWRAADVALGSSSF